MKRRHLSLIAPLLLALLVGGLGWTVYAPVRQEQLNHALIAAIKQNDTKKALALLAEGADANSRDMPPQHLSLWRLFIDRLRGKHPAPSVAPTALLLACSWTEKKGMVAKSPDNPVLVRALLDRGPALGVKGPYQGRTPLIWAIQRDKTNVSTLLIEKGANVNATDTNGLTPLILAVRHNNKPLVELLLKRGADVNAVGRIGYEYFTPLTLALLSEEDEPTITRMLLSKGARVNEGYAWMPLALAIWNDRPRTMRVLLHYGADVNINTHMVLVETPLKLAKTMWDKKIVQMLEQAGAKE